MSHTRWYFLTLSSAVDSRTRTKVAIKKLYRPFQSELFAKRAYRELRLLKHMKHENVSHVSDPQDCISIFFFIIKNEGQKMISTCSVSLCRWSACWTCSLPTSLWTNSTTCECHINLHHPCAQTQHDIKVGRVFLLVMFSFSSQSYLVMPFMGTDLGKVLKLQRLSEEKIQYLVYQMLRGLKVEDSTLVAHCRQLVSWCDCSVDKVPLFFFHYSTFTLLV